MDMKRILQAMDGVATKPVAGASEMSKFLRVVSEADINPSTNPRRADPKDQATTYIQFSSGLYSQSSIPDSISITADLSLPVTFTPLTQGADTSKTVQANINAANASLPKELQKTPEELSQIVGGADKPYAGPSINDINQPVGTPVQENSIGNFLSIVDKNDVSLLMEGNPHKVSLPVQMAMQHYQKEKPVDKPVGRETTIGKYFHKVEEEIAEEKAKRRQLLNQYASVIAERVLMKEGQEVVNEKSTSEKQARFMAAAAHDPNFAKKVGIKQSVAKEFNKADTGTKQLSNAMKKKKKVKENEIPGHSMGFKPVAGPGPQSNIPDSGHLSLGETPLDFNKDEPMSSTIHSHQGVNPASIRSRMLRASKQMSELAEMAKSENPNVWQHLARLFPELSMNVEQVKHGIEELAEIKAKGGRRSANIPSGLDRPNSIKEANTLIKTVKPKKKTSTCRAGQIQTGVQSKDGMTVPKCSVKKVL